MIGALGTCMGCGRRRERGMVEITTMGEAEPSYIPGRWESCCGWPVATWVPGMGSQYLGPDVPSPEDLLRAAGLWRLI